MAVEKTHLPDVESLYLLLQDRFGIGVNDPKNGFSLADLASVMSGFDTHPEAGK